MVHKILIVDDDQVYRDALQAEFNQQDEYVITAGDGEEAIAKVKESHPDVMILDIMLPKVLGLSVIEKVKADEISKFLPIIALSNFGGDFNRDRIMELGASEFLVKAQLTTKEIADIGRKYLPK